MAIVELAIVASLLYVWISFAGVAYGRCVAVVVEDGDEMNEVIGTDDDNLGCYYY